MEHHHGNRPFRSGKTSESLIKPEKIRMVSTKSPLTLIELPKDLQREICALDIDVFAKYNCLSRTAATRTHYTDNLQKQGPWIEQGYSNCSDQEVTIECYYKDGKRQGKVTSFHVSTGEVAEMSTCVDGMKTGYSTEHDEDGVIEETTYYKDGLKHGECMYWDLGILRGELEYKNGKIHGEYIEYLENGSFEVRANYFEDKIHGLYQRWFVNGNPEEETNWKHGIEHGRHREWHVNGQLYEESNYVEGELVGIKKVYSFDGTLNYHAKFVAGNKDPVEVYTDLKVKNECPTATMARFIDMRFNQAFQDDAEE